MFLLDRMCALKAGMTAVVLVVGRVAALLVAAPADAAAANPNTMVRVEHH